jgi:hypothetical protein
LHLLRGHVAESGDFTFDDKFGHGVTSSNWGLS